MGTVAGNAAESVTAPHGAARGEVPNTCGKCSRSAASAGPGCCLRVGAAVAEEGWTVIATYDGTDYLVLCQQVTYYGPPKSGMFWEPVAIANLPVADLP